MQDICLCGIYISTGYMFIRDMKELSWQDGLWRERHIFMHDICLCGIYINTGYAGYLFMQDIYQYGIYIHAGYMFMRDMKELSWQHVLFTWGMAGQTSDAPSKHG